jgi:hypothetical protein
MLILTSIAHAVHNHDPSSGTRPGGKVELEKGAKLAPSYCCGSVSMCKFVKVNHVHGNMHKSADDHGPGGGLMEGEVLVKGDDVVKRCAMEEGDEIVTDREKDEDNVDMQDKSG